MENETFNVLLVEDNLDHAELVQRSFGDHHLGKAIHHVEDGEAALDYLFRRGAYSGPSAPPKPNIILLDLRLPKVDGLEVLRQVKEDEGLKRIPVIILTTSDAEVDLVRAWDGYTNSYLVKPLDFDKFVKLMNDLGVYWLDWNRSI